MMGNTDGVISCLTLYGNMSFYLCLMGVIAEINCRCYRIMKSNFPFKKTYQLIYLLYLYTVAS